MSQQSIYDRIPATRAPVSYGRKLIKWIELDAWSKEQRLKLINLDYEQKMLADTYLGIAAVLPYELQLDIFERVIGTQKQAVEMKKMSSQAALEKIALNCLRLIPPEFVHVLVPIARDAARNVLTFLVGATELAKMWNLHDIPMNKMWRLNRSTFCHHYGDWVKTLTLGVEIDFYIPRKAKNTDVCIHQDAFKGLFAHEKDASCAGFPSLRTVYLVAEHISPDSQEELDWPLDDRAGLPGLVDVVPTVMQLLKQVRAKKYLVVVGADDIWQDSVATIHHEVEAPARYADLVKTAECLNGEAFEIPEQELMEDKHMGLESRKAFLMKWREDEE